MLVVNGIECGYDMMTCYSRQANLTLGIIRANKTLRCSVLVCLCLFYCTAIYRE